MAKKSFLEKSINRKIGGMKRSSKAQMKKGIKNSGCGTLILWFFLICVGIIILSVLFF